MADDSTLLRDHVTLKGHALAAATRKIRCSSRKGGQFVNFLSTKSD